MGRALLISIVVLALALPLASSFDSQRVSSRGEDSDTAPVSRLAGSRVGRTASRMGRGRERLASSKAAHSKLGGARARSAHFALPPRSSAASAAARARDELLYDAT
jgi:hypothetical protein